MSLPPEADAENLVGVGVEAVVAAADQFDESRGVPWAAFALQRARWAIADEVRRASGRNRAAKLELLTDAGAVVSPAHRPDQIAEVREMVTGRSVSRLAETLPAPDVVAERVTALREAMYGCIQADDVRDMMAAVLAKAKGGNVGAAKLIVEMLSPSRGGTKVVQNQAVIIHKEDIQ